MSTVGFRTGGKGNDQLSCVATTTGGLFVTADNAEQLAARLKATQDLAGSSTALTSSGFGTVALGQSAVDIRAENPGFPPVDAKGQSAVVWHDCTLTFQDGRLVMIAPRDGGRTIDGIAPGSTVRQAVTFYGEPVQRNNRSDGGELLIFTADEKAGTAYRMTTDSVGENAKVTSIVLCTCLPRKAANSDPTRLTFGGTDQIQAGMSERDLTRAGITPKAAKEHGCNAYDVPGAPYLKAYAAKGTVVGVMSVIRPPGQTADPAVHTINGIRVRSTADDVRRAFSQSTMTETYEGLGSTNVIAVTNGSGGYIGFIFAGNSDASSKVAATSTVQSINAGTQSLSVGHEVCSG